MRQWNPTYAMMASAGSGVTFWSPLEEGEWEGDDDDDGDGGR